MESPDTPGGFSYVRGSGAGTASHATVKPSPKRPSATHSQDPYGGFRTTCDAFGEFFNELTSRPPREQVPQLLHSAAIVDNVAARDDQEHQSAKTARVRADADALLAYVADPYF